MGGQGRRCCALVNRLPLVRGYCLTGLAYVSSLDLKLGHNLGDNNKGRWLCADYPGMGQRTPQRLAGGEIDG
jgi:hypothetical protein